MSRSIIQFNNYSTALQGNSVQISFNRVVDETVLGGYANKYRYRYQCNPIYCGQLQGNDQQYYGYAYYNTEGWVSLGDWTTLTFPNNGSSPEVSFDFTVPQLSWDALLRIEVQVIEDSTNAPYTVERGGNYTQSFICFYNRTPQISLAKAERVLSKTVRLTGQILSTGIAMPYNFSTLSDLGSKVYGDYCNAMLQCFYSKATPFLTLRWRGATSQGFASPEIEIIKQIEIQNAAEFWYPHTFEVDIDTKDEHPTIDENVNAYFRLELSYEIAPEEEFKFAADQADGIFYSNTLLVAASVSTFQIKRRGVKAHMLENDPTLGTYATGGGMFNHGEEVGFVPSPLPLDKRKQEVDILAQDGISNVYIETVNGSSTGYTSYTATDGSVSPRIPIHLTFADTNHTIGLSGVHYKLIIGWTSDSGEQKLETIFDNNEWEITATGYRINNRYDAYALLTPVADCLLLELSVLALAERLQLEGRHQLTTMIFTLEDRRGPLDKTKGHSIALYDMHTVKDTYANEPSIGFMNDKHQTVGYLRYDSVQNALVSNLPIKGNNIDVDDDVVIQSTIEVILHTCGGQEPVYNFVVQR